MKDAEIHKHVISGFSESRNHVPLPNQSVLNELLNSPMPFSPKITNVFATLAKNQTLLSNCVAHLCGILNTVPPTVEVASPKSKDQFIMVPNKWGMWSLLW